MTNHETPSDLQGFRRTEAGYFAAPAPVLAEPLLEAGLKPAFKHGEAREGQRTACPDRLDSRGGRSNSDFAGGRLEASHAGRRNDRDNSPAFGVAARSSEISSANVTECRISARPASNSIQGKGRWT